MGIKYSALMLTEESRVKILQTFRSAFSLVKCDHVTVNYPAKNDDEKHQNHFFTVFVVGYKIDTELGVECLVVEVNGRLTRPDGCLYHLTLSLDPTKNAKAVLSNEILSDHQYQKLNESFEITTEFKLIKRINV
ncbi:hypothetical protein [Pseudoalteromonas sp. ZZD1]|uniref:hypothetical protein n=1 Tax=Pseudoalteromonas sp. ZZD1 TaxID=3139395 RepID=UPI003BAA5FD7